MKISSTIAFLFSLAFFLGISQGISAQCEDLGVEIFQDECDDVSNVHSVTFSIVGGTGNYEVVSQGGTAESTDGLFFADIPASNDPYTLEVTDLNTGCVINFEQLFEDCVKLCDAEAGTLVGVNDGGTYCEGQAVSVSAEGFASSNGIFSQAYILTDASDNVVAVSLDGDFGSLASGAYCLYQYNYVTEDGAVPAVGASLPDFLTNSSEGGCYDIGDENGDCAAINVSDSPIDISLEDDCDPETGVHLVTWSFDGGLGDYLVSVNNGDFQDLGGNTFFFVEINSSSELYSLTVVDQAGCSASFDTTFLDCVKQCDALGGIVLADETTFCQDEAITGISGEDFQDNILFTQVYVLVNSDGIVVGIDESGSFAGQPSGIYSAYGLNYVTQDGLSVAVGDNFTEAINAAGDVCLNPSEESVDIAVLANSEETMVSATTCDPAEVGMVSEMLTNAAGCDSLVVTTTTLAESSETNIAATSCDPADVGVVTETLTNAAGCDSLVVTTTTLAESSETNLTAVTCDPANVGVVTETLTNAAGCDSLVVTTTTLGESTETTVNATTCDPAEVGTVTETFAGSSCDSVVITITTLLPSDQTDLTAVTCDPAEVGVVTETFTNVAGCDSLVTTTTTLGESTTTTINATTCDASQVGTVTETFAGASCDSIVTTITTLLPSDQTNINATTCDASQVGVVTETFTNAAGCDSLVTTTTTLANGPDVSLVPDAGTICSGSSIALTASSSVAGVVYSWSASAGSLSASSGSTNNYTMGMPGTYQVTVTATDLNGCSSSAVANITVETCNQTGSIGDFVFYDFNADGIYNNNDEPKVGATLFLYDGNGNFLASATTDANGNYIFDNLAPGTYEVCLSVNPSTVVTTATCITVDLDAGEAYTTADFGCFFLLEGSIGDLVYYDTNENGIFDTGDTPKAGVTVTLFDETGASIATAVTNSQGNYLFDGLFMGTYTVCVTVDASSTLTTPSCYTVNLGDGENYLAADFGCFIDVPDNGSIGDFVFNDNNNNGVFDAGDTPKSGATVFLYDANGNNIASATTNNDGFYSFGGLNAGDYTVCLATSSNPNVVITTASCFSVSLGQNENYVTADFGCYLAPPADDGSIGNFVFFDANGNGIFDAGDEPKVGATIYLYDENGNNIATATTNSQGNYDFTGLAAGTYVVCIATSPSTTITTASCYTVALGANQDYNDADFGCVPVDTVGPCGAESGEIALVSNSAVVCNGSAISVTANGFAEGGDIDHIFLLTDQNDIIVAISVNSGVFTGIPFGQYTVYSFSYDVTDFSGMPVIGQDFFANYLANGQACYDVSDGIPVSIVQGLNVAADISEDCIDDGEGVFMVTFSVSGGSNTTYTLTGDVNQTVSSGQEITLLIPELSNYAIDISDPTGCTESVFIVTGGCSKSSVELIEFDGRVAKEGNLLFWATATEENSKYFQIERSLDGTNFELVGTVEAANNSNTLREYSLMDANAPTGLSYYRLSEVDLDGKVTYADVISLERRGSTTISISPVPAKGDIQVSFVENLEGDVQVRMFDVAGKLIRQVATQVSAGQLNLDIKDLATGTYFLNVTTENQTYSSKFIKE